MSNVNIIVGDARHLPFPDEYFHTVVTSPPYWGLRDYGLEPIIWGGDKECEHEWSYKLSVGGRKGDTNPGSLQSSATHNRETRGSEICEHCNAWQGAFGLEPTPELYTQHLVEIFREVKRTLRDDGTLWLNLGDSYASGSGGPQGETTITGGRRVLQEKRRASIASLKPKDLVGIPWMVAFALRTDGWYLRSDIIWHKPNVMPESVRDRPTKAHEYLFLLSKSKRYYYDQVAVMEDAAWERWGAQRSIKRQGKAAMPADLSKAEIEAKFPKKRNHRSVWTITTQPFSGAHFAVFPEKLVKPCILAGSSEHGCCKKCGAPWKREVKKTRTFESGSVRSGNLPAGKNGPNLQGGGETLDIRRGPVVSTQTLGWRPTCNHDSRFVPCRVLDPFAGSGTVGVVSQQLKRSAFLIDANQEYCHLAIQRCELTN